MCDGLSCVLELVRRWVITGFLHPVRNLTLLTQLELGANSIGGMCVRAAVYIGGGVGVLIPLSWDFTASHTRDMALQNCIGLRCNEHSHGDAGRGVVCFRGIWHYRHSRSCAQLDRIDPVFFVFKQHRRYVRAHGFPDGLLLRLRVYRCPEIPQSLMRDSVSLQNHASGVSFVDHRHT